MWKHKDASRLGARKSQVRELWQKDEPMGLRWFQGETYKRLGVDFDQINTKVIPIY
ncbi:hypothetical protein INT81_03420 [Riemerella anatipestifer]|nr:hypothetical protein [Riemerella anatipestifer]